MKLIASIFVACSGNSLTREINTECPSLDQLEACEGDCEAENLACIKGCDNDTHCISGCTREFAACTEVCPCYTSCFDGCPCEYSSQYCEEELSCEEIHLDEYKICADQVHESLMECINQCPPFDTACDHDCSAESEKELQNCPCMNKCEGGCPCPNYHCSTDRIMDFVVVAKTSLNQKRVSIDLEYDPLVAEFFEAKLDEDETFDHRGHSCSFFIRKRAYIVGGTKKNGDFDYTKRQAVINSKNQHYRRLEDLPEEMMDAVCAPYDNNSAMICSLYGNGARRDCYTAFAPKETADLKFKKVAQTKMNHFRGGMGQQKGQPIIFWGTNSGTTEMYDAETDSWSIIAENDEMLGHIHMSVVSFHGSILAFGGNTNGEDNSSTKMVWQLAKRKDVWSWDEFKETLMVPRTQHTSITKGNTIIHIGGFNDKHYEVWDRNSETNEWIIRETKQKLTKWIDHPIAFWVNTNDFNEPKSSLFL